MVTLLHLYLHTCMIILASYLTCKKSTKIPMPPALERATVTTKDHPSYLFPLYSPLFPFLSFWKEISNRQAFTVQDPSFHLCFSSPAFSFFACDALLRILMRCFCANPGAVACESLHTQTRMTNGIQEGIHNNWLGQCGQAELHKQAT